MIRSISIPAAVGAAPGVYTESITPASVFYCLSATAAVNVRAENNPDISVVAGKGFGNPQASKFDRVAFYNSTPQAVDLTFYAGTEYYNDANIPNVYEATFVYAGKMATISPGYVLAAGASMNFLTQFAIGGKTYRRQAFTVTNQGPAILDLKLMTNGVAGDSIDFIPVGVPRLFGDLYKANDFQLKNSTGANAVIAVSEVMLSNPLS